MVSLQTIKDFTYPMPTEKLNGISKEGNEWILDEVSARDMFFLKLGNRQVVNSLRTEAILHIKKLKQMEKASKDLVVKGKIRAQISWCYHFFDLTKEELK